MTARCVRVVQNLSISSSPHLHEKDVPPSVLSSGDALSPNPVRCTRLQARAFNGPSVGIEPGCAMRTCWSVRSPVRAFLPDTLTIPMETKAKGAFSAPLRNPSTRTLEKCLSIWTDPCSKGGMLAPPCAIPSTRRACHGPSWTPSTNNRPLQFQPDFR